MTADQLKEKYRAVFGEVSRSNRKQFFFRRIVWRVQANVLSERARKRALEIAEDADLRIRAPKNFLKAELDESRTLGHPRFLLHYSALYEDHSLERRNQLARHSLPAVSTPRKTAS